MSLTNWRPRANRDIAPKRSAKYLTEAEAQNVENHVHETLSFLYLDRYRALIDAGDQPIRQEWPFNATQDILWAFIKTAAHRGTSEETEYGEIELRHFTTEPLAAVAADNLAAVPAQDYDVPAADPGITIDLDLLAAVISELPGVTIRRYCGYYAEKILQYAKEEDIQWDWGKSNNISKKIGAYGFDFWQWLPSKFLPRDIYLALEKAFRSAVNHAPTQEYYYGSEATLGESSQLPK